MSLIQALEREEQKKIEQGQLAQLKKQFQFPEGCDIPPGKKQRNMFLLLCAENKRLPVDLCGRGCNGARELCAAACIGIKFA